MKEEQYDTDNYDGSSLVRQVKVGSLQNNEFVVIQGKPCRIVDLNTHKTGKHGHGIANIVGIDIFTKVQCLEILPTASSIDVPIITRKDFQLVDINTNGFAILLDDQGFVKEDIKLAQGSKEQDMEMNQKLQQAVKDGNYVRVDVISAMGIEKIMNIIENEQISQFAFQKVLKIMQFQWFDNLVVQLK